MDSADIWIALSVNIDFRDPVSAVFPDSQANLKEKHRK